MKKTYLLFLITFSLSGQKNDFVRILKDHFQHSGQQISMRNDSLFIQVFEKETEQQPAYNQTMIVPLYAIDHVGIVQGKNARGEAGISVQIYAKNFQKNEFKAVDQVLNEKQIGQVNTASINQKIQGQVSGVTIGNDNSPGGGAMVRIRGIGSINSNVPLYVIDDVPFTGNINAINPHDIESVNILKNPAETALYGVRGANGVIVIKTKKGASAQVNTLDQEIPVILWTWGKDFDELKRTGNLKRLRKFVAKNSF